MDFRKLVGLAVLVLLLGAVDSVNANPLNTVQWYGRAGDLDWYNDQNWYCEGTADNNLPQAPPTDVNIVKINHVIIGPPTGAGVGDGPVIAEPGATCAQLKIGEIDNGANVASKADQFMMVTTGGAFNIVGTGGFSYILLGYYGSAIPPGAYSQNRGTFIMNGGQANAFQMFDGFAGTGHLYVNGGLLNISNMLGVGFNDLAALVGGRGYVYVNGGVLHTQARNLTYAPAHGGSALIDITGGTWLLNNNWAIASGTGEPNIMDEVTAGRVTAYGGTGTIHVIYDSNTNRTMITATPAAVDNNAVHLWNYNKMQITQRSSTIVVIDNNTGDEQYALSSMFEGGNTGPGSKQTLFADGNPTGYTYSTQWRMARPVKVTAFTLRAEHDAAPPYHRAIQKFRLKAKNGDGGGTWNLVLYDANVAVPYDNNNVKIIDVTLAKPVIARDFRAEFIGNDANGPRIWELDGRGFENINLDGDLAYGGLSATYTVDVKDYALLASTWLMGTPSGRPASTQSMETFESYSSLPGTWTVQWGHPDIYGGWTDNALWNSNVPSLALATSGAHGGTKCLQYNYDLRAPDDPCLAAMNTATYALSSPLNLGAYQAFNFWVKRPNTNPVETRFDVRFLNDNNQPLMSTMAYSSPISTSDPNYANAWAPVSFNIAKLAANGLTPDMLTGVTKIQFRVFKGTNLTGGNGTIYIDDIGLTKKLVGDINNDGKVDFWDLKLLTGNWLIGK
jgi:hypothetical protein